MNTKNVASICAGALLALAVAGCGRDANSTNAGGGNTRSNTNTVVSTNANAGANTATNTSANTSANRASYNANITREEYERNKGTYTEEARQAGRTIGKGANDGWLWVKVRAALAAAEDLRDSTINVDVENGVVTLSGDVADGNQKVRAVDVAKKVQDVKSVNNKLQVRGGGSTNANAGGGKKKNG